VSLFFFSSRRRHTSSKRDWSSDVCSSDLQLLLHAIDQLTVFFKFTFDCRDFFLGCSALCTVQCASILGFLLCLGRSLHRLSTLRVPLLLCQPKVLVDAARNVA